MVDTLPLKKRGCPLLLGSELDNKVKSYIKEAMVAGLPLILQLSWQVEKIVRKNKKNLLKDNAGPIDINKTWAKSLLSRLGYVRQKASSTAKVEPPNYEQLKDNVF